MKSKELANALIGYDHSVIGSSVSDADIIAKVNGLIETFKVDNGPITKDNIMEAFKIIFEGGGSNLSHVQIAGVKLALGDLLAGGALKPEVVGRVTEIISHKPKLAFLCLVAQEMGVTSSAWLKNAVWLAMNGGVSATATAASPAVISTTRADGRTKTIADYALESADAIKRGSEKNSEFNAMIFGEVAGMNTAASVRADAETAAKARSGAERRAIDAEMGKSIEIEAGRAIALGRVELHDKVLSAQQAEIHNARVAGLGAEAAMIAAATDEATKRFAAMSVAGATAYSSGIARPVVADPRFGSSTLFAASTIATAPGIGSPAIGGSGAMPTYPAAYAPHYTPSGT